MKKIKYIIVIFSFLLIVTGCKDPNRTISKGNGPEAPPLIEVKVGDSDIPYILGKNQWDGAIYDREDNFQAILKETDKEIVEISYGDIANIKFLSDNPEKIIVERIILNEENIGNQEYIEDLYNEDSISKIDVDYKNGETKFPIEKTKDNQLLGYSIFASWGADEAEYSFVIRAK